MKNEFTLTGDAIAEEIKSNQIKIKELKEQNDKNIQLLIENRKERLKEKKTS